jgi:UDP-N-acetylmuramate dehydrogenase
VLSELRAALEAEGVRCVPELPLAEHTTYRVGGPADLAVFPRSPEQLARIQRTAAAKGLPVTLLGLGSNVLVADRGIRGVVVLLRDLAHIQVDDAVVRAGAGADCTAVAACALEAGLEGLEFFHHLPGSVGGAAFMNARAFDQEMSQVWRAARLVTPEGRLVERRFSSELFRYKHSPLQESGEIAAELTLRLTPGAPAAIAARMERNERQRRKNGEFCWPSCGCVFKNDRRIGVPSGRLIDQCGLKGFSIGGARVSPLHANFVVNAAKARAADLRAVIEHVRAEVERRTGHRLEPEVRLLGQW